jgi:2,5-diketo-D-gluconate reductase B
MDPLTGNGDIPAIGFGVYRMEPSDVLRMVPHVLLLGYRHIDTAQIYGNEAEVGEGLAASGVPRPHVFLTTKVWIANYGRDAFHSSVDESLTKLRTDYVDLLLLHWPNDQTPLADQIEALNQVRAAGKTRHIGVSNFNTAQMDEAIALSEAPLLTNQVEYHPHLDQSAILAATRAAGLKLTAYYAMADGAVFGDPILKDIASRHDRSIAQVVLRWLVQQDGVVALTKTIQEGRATSNFAVFDFALAEHEMAAIHALARADGRRLDPEGLSPRWD